MSFSFLIGLGAALGLLQVYRHTPPKESTRWIDASLLVMFLGLLGSRLVFVLLHLSYYREHVLETLQFWQGGLSVYGALAGGLLAAGILSLTWKKSYSTGLRPVGSPHSTPGNFCLVGLHAGRCGVWQSCTRQRCLGNAVIG